MRLNCRNAANSVFSSPDSPRISARCPPFQAFRDTRALPSGVDGPVDCSHGFQRLISSACRCLRSKVQPFAMICLQ